MAITEDSKLGEVLDNPKAKAVLEKHMPDMGNVSPQMLAMARGMSLKQVAGFPQSGLTPEKMEAIMEELSKL